MTNTPVFDRHGNELPSEWIHEFCGFYWGEGCLHASWRKNGRWGHAFQVSSQIGLRIDDTEILEDFHDKLGGRLRTDNDGTVRWVVAVCEECLRVVQILECSVLPAIKRRQLRYWKRCLEIKRDRPPNGYAYPEETVAEIDSLVEMLARLKQVSK